MQNLYITKKLQEAYELATQPKLNVFHMVSGQGALQTGGAGGESDT